MNPEPNEWADLPPTVPGSHFEVPQEGDAQLSAWEEVAAGRFMPRRIKGSCKGRALG